MTPGLEKRMNRELQAGFDQLGRMEMEAEETLQLQLQG